MSTQTHRASGDHHVEIYDNPADSVGSWMIAILVTAIPVVGFIYLVVVAFGPPPRPHAGTGRVPPSPGTS